MVDSALKIGWTSENSLSLYTLYKFLECAGKGFNWCNRPDVMYAKFLLSAIRLTTTTVFSFMILMI